MRRYAATIRVHTLCMLLVVSTITRPLVGQSRRATGNKARVASSLLDGWIVTRHRGAQLLPDPLSPVAPQQSVPATVMHPRVEAVRTGERSGAVRGAIDTLIAVHFSPLRAAPALAVDAFVQLAGPSGTITPLAPRVVERRAFRAPRRPGSAIARPDSSWRYGWAYLATIPRTTGRAATRYRGWMLLAGP